MGSRPLHVIHLTPHFYWPHLEKKGWPVKFDAMGGMQTQIFRQVSFLDALGIRQLVITLKIPGAPKDHHFLKNSRIIGKRIPICPMRSRIRGMMDLNFSWGLGTLLFIFRNRKSLKKSYHILHCHCSGVGTPLMVGYLASKILNIPFITSIHCSAIATYQPMSYLDRYFHKANKLIEKKVLSKTNHAIFLTERSLAACSKHVKGLKEKASIVSDSIDSVYFNELKNNYSRSDFLEQFKIPTNVPICTYVGRIAREKGWRDLITLSEHASYHFLIVGDGNEFDLMKQEVKKKKLCKKFTFTGYLPQEKIPLAMSLATVLLLPSQHEEFGSVLLESMAMGLVSIAYKVGGVNAVLIHKENGLLAENVEEMLYWMEALLRKPSLQQAIATKAQKIVKEKYGIATTCNTIDNIYKTLAKKRA